MLRMVRKREIPPGVPKNNIPKKRQKHQQKTNKYLHTDTRHSDRVGDLVSQGRGGLGKGRGEGWDRGRV